MNIPLNLYKNSVKTLKVSVPDVPSGTTLTKAYFMLKGSWTDADGSALLTLTIDAGATSQGQITDTGADGIGELQFQIGASALNSISDYSKTYYSGIKVILSNGSAYLLPLSLMPTKIHAPAITATS